MPLMRSSWRAAVLSLCLIAAPAVAREISFSFDDAPRSDGQHFTGVQRTEALIQALESGGVPGAIFFATSRQIDEPGDARLKRYAEAGHYIANHSHSHAAPDAQNLQPYLDDIDEADRRLRDYDGFLALYRFPFLNEGRDPDTRDAIRAHLVATGYGQGYVTVDNYDWYMEALFQRALAAGREVDYERLGELYVELLVAAVDFYDGIAVEHLGRSPRHVLLLHENDLAALFVDDLARALKADGWTLVSGPAAYEDPIADIEPDTVFLGQGRVAAMAEVTGVPRPSLVHEAEDEAWLEARFEAEGVFGPARASSSGGVE